MAKIVVINGSPQMEKGNTAMMLQPFIEGMREAGSEVELFYASRLKPAPCTGELFCWFKHPGKCYIQDTLQEIYPTLQAAQTIVLATPIYIPLPGAMQDVLNRLCPLMEPHLTTVEGRTRARVRPGVALERIALVSTGGWWEIENFDTVLRIAEEFAADASVPFAGAVLRPHAALMRHEGKLTPGAQEILDAAREAGRQLATDGVMNEQTLAAISRPLVPQEAFRSRLNQLLQADG
jgi:multimeric flavodoxin WrbA